MKFHQSWPPGQFLLATPWKNPLLASWKKILPTPLIRIAFMGQIKLLKLNKLVSNYKSTNVNLSYNILHDNRSLDGEELQTGSFNKSLNHLESLHLL